MKKPSAFVAILVALFTAIVVSQPSPVVHAYAADEEAIGSASIAIDELYTLIEKSADTPNEEFFPVFAEHADTTRQVISRTYADLGRTEEIEDAKIAIDGIRSSLSEMKKELSEWKEIALANDADAFDKMYAQFDATVGDYNSAIDTYNQSGSSESEDAFFGTLLLGLLAIAIILPIIFAIRSKRLKVRSKDLTIADNPTLAISTRKFMLLSALTLGLYLHYWAWQSWEIVAKANDKKYHSTIRAWFIPITAFSLFEKIHTHAKETGYKKSFNHRVLAVLLLLTFLAAAVLWQFQDNFAILIAVTIAEVALIILLVMPVLKVQRHFVMHTKKQLRPLGKDSVILFLITVSFYIVIFSLITTAVGY